MAKPQPLDQTPPEIRAGVRSAAWPGSGFESGTASPHILLSSHAIAEDAMSGATVGALSVVNGSGMYVFTITSDPDNLFDISSSNLITTGALDYETATLHHVTVQADNSVDDPFTHTFSIHVTNVVENPVFTVAPVVSGALDDALSCTTGTLALPDGAGATFAYQWRDASDDSDLTGETTNTLDVSDYDGLDVYCTVTATNGAGSTPDDSNTVGPLEGGTGPSVPTNAWTDGGGTAYWTDGGGTAYWTDGPAA